jgi:hypothetical protein
VGRFRQATFVICTLLLSWLWMQVVHELGHILAATATGGSVVKVVLYPLEISRTDVRPNPRPLLVAWAGPAFGAAVPVIIWAIGAAVRFREAYLLRFFAGFCLIANGAYIAVGSFGRIGDCGEMLRHGSPIWALWLFGAVTIPTGLLMWNGLGKYFGFGGGSRDVNCRVTVAIAAALLITVALEVTIGR